jgi:hypothetical protein
MVLRKNMTDPFFVESWLNFRLRTCLRLVQHTGDLFLGKSGVNRAVFFAAGSPADRHPEVIPC